MHIRFLERGVLPNRRNRFKQILLWAPVFRRFEFFFDGYIYDNSRFKVHGARLVDIICKSYEVDVTLEVEYYKRMFVKGKTNIKIEPVFDPYERSGDLQTKHGIYVDSKENIAANKLSDVSGRRMTKDFFDLFFPLKEIDFTDAVRHSEYKQVPLDYESIMLAVGDLLSSSTAMEGEILTESEIDGNEFKAFVTDFVERLIAHAKSQ